MYLNELTEALQDAENAVSFAPEWPKVQIACVLAHSLKLTVIFRDTIAKVRFLKDWNVLTKRKYRTTGSVNCKAVVRTSEKVRSYQKDF